MLLFFAALRQKEKQKQQTRMAIVTDSLIFAT
jgi:hypothetical protein